MTSQFGIWNLYLFIRHLKSTIISKKCLSVWNYLGGMSYIQIIAGQTWEVCVLYMHQAHVCILSHWKYSFAGLIISLWSRKNKGEVCGLGQKQGTGQVSRVIFVSRLLAKGFFVPLMTVQEKCCNCRSADKAGTAWISLGCRHWHWPSGTRFSRLRSFAQVDGNAAIVSALQSWSIFQPFLLLPWAPQCHSAYQGWAKHTQVWEILPKVGVPPITYIYLYLYIYTRAHPALPPSGMLTQKGGVVKSYFSFWVLFSPNAMNTI